MSTEHEPGIRILLSVRGAILNPRKDMLLIKRSANNKSDVEKWELSGGKVEDGETLDNSLKREIKEETGIEINTILNPTAHVANKVIPDGKYQGMTQVIITKVIYLPETPTVKLSEEHEDYIWVAKETALNMNLKDSTREALLAFDFL